MNVLPGPNRRHLAPSRRPETTGNPKGLHTPPALQVQVSAPVSFKGTGDPPLKRGRHPGTPAAAQMKRVTAGGGVAQGSSQSDPRRGQTK